MAKINFAKYAAHVGVTTLALTGLPVVAAHAQQVEPLSDVASDEVLVVGYRAQSEQAVAAKRDEARIADFLAADDISGQPDYNISDAIRRLPGVQTIFDEDEGKFISVRGLNPSYTMATLDGVVLATSERQNRQLNLEAVPSGAIKGVTVFKSRTPDSDGNAIGGTVALRTRSAFDSDGFYASGTFLVGTSDSKDVPGEGFGRDTDDGLNFRLDATISNTFGSANQFGFLIGVNFLERNRDQERLLPQVVPAGVTSTPTAASTLGTTDLLWSNYPNTITRYGGIVKFEYQPSSNFLADISLAHYRQDDNELRHSQRLRNQTGGNASFVRFNDFPLEKPTTIGQTHFEWDVSEDHKIKGRAGYSEAQFLEPSNEVQFNLANPAGTFDLAIYDGVPVASNLDPRLSNPANYRLTSFAPYQDDSDEYVREASLDYGFNTDKGDMGWGFGFGANWREIVRDNDSTRWSWTYNGTQTLTLADFDVSHNYTPIYANFTQLFVDFQKFQDFFHANFNDFSGGINLNRGSDWLFTEQVSALYGLAKYRSDRATLIFGGRWEETQTEVERQRTQGGVGSRVTREGSYDNFLPSLTFTYDITDRLRFRTAAFSGVGRPNPSQLASAETVNNDGTISRGNPNLEAREGDSLDASLEYYLPGNGGVFSIGVFKKFIDNEIVNFTSKEPLGPNGALVDVTQPDNIQGAEVAGLELLATINSLPLPGLLSNFGLSANATFLDGESELSATRTVDFLTGQADFLGNVAVFYEQGPFRARVAYAHIGEFVTSANATNAASDRTDKATNTVDVQARYTLTDNLELMTEVRNLSDEKKVNYTGPNQNIYRDVSFYGRQFWMGANFKF